ncbi:MAG TPA: c-type cytochrome [Oceanithermus profundus]|uniref:C-type cytochrome n=1 Tax=Oceanithermus profundus TaxID=187137 RepID=A0A7C4V681_9DEIN|nr:c-type cytochrome [Oceanithermus profundus]
MNQNIERIEVFLDESKEPLQVLTGPPFKVTLDTRQIPDGPHTLRVVTTFKGGQVEEEVIDFEVDNLPGPFIDGIDDGQQVRGSVEFEVVSGDYAAPKSGGGLSIVGAVLSAVLVLGLVWFYFAFAPSAKEIVKETAAAPQEATAHEGAAGDAAAGKDVFAAQCAICHGANAEGGAGPALAGAPIVENAAQFDKIVKEGTGGGMPPFAQLSDKEIADVRAYLSSLGGGAAPAGEEAAPAAAPAGGAVDSAVMSEGEQLYLASCASCHQPNGTGMATFPALAGNANLADADLVIDRILNGKVPMPGFAGQFSDEQVAAVATYIRNSWGNDFGPVSPDEVAAKR